MKNIFPPAIPKSDKDEEFRLNFTRADFKQFLNHAWNDVYWLAHLVVWMGFFGLLLSHHFDLNLQILGARMRIACCSLIYRKVKFHYRFLQIFLKLIIHFHEFQFQSLRLSALSANRTGSGYLVNLMSNDVARLDRGFIFCHYIWILPLQVSNLSTNTTI